MLPPVAILPNRESQADVLVNEVVGFNQCFFNSQPRSKKSVLHTLRIPKAGW